MNKHIRPVKMPFEIFLAIMYNPKQIGIKDISTYIPFIVVKDKIICQNRVKSTECQFPTLFLTASAYMLNESLATVPG